MKAKPCQIAILQGFLIAVLGSVALTGWASLWICLGFEPETFLMMDALAPLCGVFWGAWWAGRRLVSELDWARGRAGLAVAGCCVGFWFLDWLLLVGRFSPVLWWREGILGLTLSHFLWWCGAGITGFFGVWLGEKRPSDAAFRGVLLGILAGVWGVQGFESLGLGVERGFFPTPGVWKQRPDFDGTMVCEISAGLDAANFGIYDADEDDSTPLDDQNTTWLGQALPRVWDKIEAKTGGNTFCVVNGGFFGARFPYVAHHEAPIVQNEVARYNSSVLGSDWPQQSYVFGWKRKGDKLQLSLVQNVPFAQLGQRFDGALGGVRALIVDGKSLELKPGMGGTTLKCSRTSIAWKGEEFYILSVRDPDGEAASLRANRAKTPQVGGWDVWQVQKYWEAKGVENAVLFDGGESTQLAYRRLGGAVEMIHSSYHFTRTPFYINDQPLRFVLPMLPPWEANGGVLNYFYITGKP